MAVDLTAATPDYYVVDTAPITTYPLTLTAWGRVPDTTNSRNVIFIGDKDVTNHSFRLNFESAARIFFVAADGSFRNASVTGYSANTWHNLIGVGASSTDRKAYLDGGTPGTNTISTTPAGLDRWSVGRATDITPSIQMDGQIAEVAIYNVAFAEGGWEIAALAAGFSPLLVRPEALVRYRRLVIPDEGDMVTSETMTKNGAPVAFDHPPIIYKVPPRFWYVAAAVGAGQGGLLSDARNRLVRAA